MLIYQGELLISLVLFLLVFGMAFFNQRNTQNFVVPTPFYKRPYEFIVGFRKTYFAFILAIVLLVISIDVENFNLGIASLLIPFIVCMSFYSKSEPQFYVWIHSKTVQEFLAGKILTASLYALALSLPFAISLFTFYPHNFWIIAIFIIIGWLFIIMSLLGKYANYPSEMNVMQGFAVMFSVFFPPLTLLIIPFFYSKAKHNLASILR